MEGFKLMTKNYFSFERQGKCHEHVFLVDDNQNVLFEDLMNMSYAEMKAYEYIEDFVNATLDVANELFETGEDEQTVVTLIDEDGVFNWSMIIGMIEGQLRYVTVNWRRDNKSYRYEN